MLTSKVTRTYAVQTPKLGQNRKAAATRDALNRRGLRVTTFRFGTLLSREFWVGSGQLNRISWSDHPPDAVVAVSEILESALRSPVIQRG